ncbi:anti-repressor SinI family protein [Peribacillus glennii]|nr:anti-repressor SinI family protein [Peribacillus glennii]
MGEQQENGYLDPEWLDLLSEAIQSGASTQGFSFWLEFIKFKRNSEEEQ